MKIKVERSGGFTGIPLSTEIDTKTLPPQLNTTVKGLLSIQKTSKFQRKAIPKGGADHFIYRISIEDGQNHNVIECTEYDISGELKSLVKYVERNSKK